MEYNLAEIYFDNLNKRAPLLEKKMNDFINGISDPNWEKVLDFFRDRFFIDLPYLQSPCYGLIYPIQKVFHDKDIDQIHFNLFLSIEAPIFTAYYVAMEVDNGGDAKITLFSDQDFQPDGFDFDAAIKHVISVYPDHQFVSHKALFAEKVDWGIPLNGAKSEEGSYPFEFLFDQFYGQLDQLEVEE
ncbi:hypothetical protein P872_10810 [Rhodonellum psychrophilum GCM71 = DSM 17998]|uniref:Uncharacterized protein n=2 Tax=Rhodonellum TaxID=336827 RepID=U5BLA7_9BACT|nr:MULTISPECIES: hypothetical protein [Rhodonellum]ERM81275.1 hypothetical protein P872_10810 [Rhodonellum psychrophilum GCM71 = DSM 17998]SDY55733.1 hypothetical protein SAMN05444412_101528 [Rhodonellum ikkaensis]